jgi:ubiquinone/menaquinone biosynthesis C-methylase UbiE
MVDVIDEINTRTMRSAAAVSIYARSEGLSPPERAALDRVADEVRGKAILDIGVGGGRTVPRLLEISDDYLGVDYSREMIAACQRRFPGVRLEHADARDLSNLDDASISLAVFSCNGIGMVNHADRLLIMREVHRVLQPDGVFVFSTHNQNCPDHTAGFKFPQFERSRHPLRLLVRIARFHLHTIVRLRNRWRFRKHAVRTHTYSIINDACHNYGTMLYYISLANQRRQLEEMGFRKDAEAFDLSGRQIDDDTRDSSITLIARK